jgi:hypothetical protein
MPQLDNLDQSRARDSIPNCFLNRQSVLGSNGFSISYDWYFAVQGPL